MKQIHVFFFITCCAMLHCAAGFSMAEIEHKDIKDLHKTNAYADTTLPACIQKLNRPASSAIRSSFGALRYRNSITLSNGKILYAFSAGPSIGCNINDPASTKYYNDSCRQVASFPNAFTIKFGRRPYIASGYTPDNFPEASKGDYPAYFEDLKNKSLKNTVVVDTTKPKDPFPSEKSFKVVSLQDDILKFKIGDILNISTKNGLKHYRNKQLINTYKIIPQLVISTIEVACKVPPCVTKEKYELVYFLDIAKCFVEIKDNALLMSADSYGKAMTSRQPVRTKWKVAYRLAAQ